MQAFLFFGKKAVFFDISNFEFRTNEREVSAVHTRIPEHYTSIFVFRSKKIFFDISIFGCRTSKKEVSAVYTRYLNTMRAFLFFGPKNASSISQFLDVAQVKKRCQRYIRGA